MSRKSRKAKRRRPFDGLPEAAIRSVREQVEAEISYNLKMGLGMPKPKTAKDPISLAFDVTEDMPSPVVEKDGECFVDLSPVLGSEIGLMRLGGKLPGKVKRVTINHSPEDGFTCVFDCENE